MRKRNKVQVSTLPTYVGSIQNNEEQYTKRVFDGPTVEIHQGAASRQRPIVPRCQTESTRKPGSRSQKGRVTIFVRRYFSRLQRLACDLSCQPCGNTACDQHSQGEHCEDEGASSQRPVSGQRARQEYVGNEERTRESHSRRQAEGKSILVGIHCCDNTRRPERTLVVDAKQAAKQQDGITPHDAAADRTDV